MNGINTSALTTVSNIKPLKLQNGVHKDDEHRGDNDDDEIHRGDDDDDPYGDDDDVFVDYKYGWCGWYPNCLQGLNKPAWLLVFLCLYAIVQVRS